MKRIPAAPGAATLASIAREAGVHPATVSRILHGDVDYRRPSYARRAERIREIARRHGYLPNAAARAVASRRFGTVALLQHTADVRSWMPQGLLSAILDALEGRDLGLALSRCTDADLARRGWVPRILRAWQADGLLVNVAGGADARLRDLLRERRIPAIWINARLDADCVGVDEAGAAAALTRHLLAAGFGTVRYLGFMSAPRHPSQDERHAGWRDALLAVGREPVAVLPAPDDPDPLDDQLRARLLADRAAPGPVAWVTYSGLEAERLIAVLQGTGLRMPEDVALASFSDNRRMLALTQAQMIAPLTALGEKAVERLLRKLEDPSRALPPVLVPYDLVAGRLRR